MANPSLYNNVQMTSTTTGTGTFTLLAAVAGFQAVPASADGLKVPYSIKAVNPNGVPTGEWEDGIGTYTHSGTTLARTQVLASSNSGSAVDFAVANKRVAIVLPAEMICYPYGPIGGRLTTESGVSVSTSDRTSQGTLYWTPHNSDYLRLYNGVRIKEYVCSQKSLSLSITSGKNKDVWLYDSSGTPTLELSADWTNDTTRSEGIAFESGLGWTKSGDATRLHVGTIRASGSNVTADSGGNAGTTNVGAVRFVWNRYNQVPRNLKVIDTTDNWSYATATIRQARGTSGNKVEYVTGDAASLITGEVIGSAYTQDCGAYASVGIGVDSTTTYTGLSSHGGTQYGGEYDITPLFGRYCGYPGLGYHYLSWNECGGNLGGFYGDNGGTIQSGLAAWLLG